jgi:hypothetical protein
MVGSAEAKKSSNIEICEELLDQMVSQLIYFKIIIIAIQQLFLSGLQTRTKSTSVGVHQLIKFRTKSDGSRSIRSLASLANPKSFVSLDGCSDGLQQVSNEVHS